MPKSAGPLDGLLGITHIRVKSLTIVFSGVKINLNTPIWLAVDMGKVCYVDAPVVRFEEKK